jgi:hypothetical protein
VCCSSRLPPAAACHRWPTRPRRTAAGLLTLAAPVALPQPAAFRFWVDHQALSSPRSADLIEQALKQLGGQKTGGVPKLDPVTGQKVKVKDYGYMHLDAWDLLYSITAKAMLAAEMLRPGQLVNIIPGFLCITRKTSLVSCRCCRRF